MKETFENVFGLPGNMVTVAGTIEATSGLLFLLSFVIKNDTYCDSINIRSVKRCSI